MTEEEKEIIDSAESVIKEAQAKELEETKAYMLDMFTRIEQGIWDDNQMADRTYDLCSLRQVHQGTPESLSEYKKFRNITDPETESIWIGDKEKGMEPNTCLALFQNFVSDEQMPPTILELLHHFGALVRLHEDENGKLVGLITRTRGTGTYSENDTEAKVDVFVTSIMLGNFFWHSIRSEDGTLLPEQPDMIVVARYDDASDKENVVACAEWLGEKYGRMAFAVYTALYMPKLMKDMDPELYESMKKDALSSQDDEETPNQKEQ